MEIKKYYYNDGTTQFGPLSLEELKNANITPNTQVWYDGMGENWLPARDVAELSSLFNTNTPPRMNNNTGHQQSGQSSMTIPPPTNLVWAILSTLLCCLPLGVVAIVYAAKVEQTFYLGEYEAANRYSSLAAKWSIASAIVAFVGLVIYFIFVFAVVGLNAFN